MLQTQPWIWRWPVAVSKKKIFQLAFCGHSISFSTRTPALPYSAGITSISGQRQQDLEPFLTCTVVPEISRTCNSPLHVGHTDAVETVCTLESFLILGFCSNMNHSSFSFSLAFSFVALSLKMIKSPTSSRREQISLKFFLVKKLVQWKWQGTCRNRFTVCTRNKEPKKPQGRVWGEHRECLEWWSCRGHRVDTKRTGTRPTISVMHADLRVQISRGKEAPREKVKMLLTCSYSRIHYHRWLLGHINHYQNLKDSSRIQISEGVDRTVKYRGQVTRGHSWKKHVRGVTPGAGLNDSNRRT